MFPRKNIACSTNAFLLKPLDEALITLHNLGFSSVEILCDHPHLFPPDINNNELSYVAKLLSKMNLTISNLNANTASGKLRNLERISVDEGPSLISNSADERLKRIDYTKNVIKIARDIGARNISVSSGCVKNRINKNKSLNYFLDSLKRIIDFAEKFKIEVGIEPEPKHFINTTSKLSPIFKKVNSKYLGINFDIGHSYLANEKIHTMLKKFHKKIFNIHIEDIQGKKHIHLPLGDGNIDFVEFFKILNKIQYDSFVTIELYSCYKDPEVAIKKSLKYLGKIFAN